MKSSVLPRIIAGFAGLMLLAGCGTAVQRGGTEQLLLADSVDRAVDQLDLSPLAGRHVYLDTEYLKPVKSNLFVNVEYITSALRQKLTTSGCTVEKNRADAEYVLEPRIGALGVDSMEVTYGVPASGGVGQAASVLAGGGMMPSFPEVSFGKRTGNIAISKLAVYAYHQETGIPVWQSGSAVARSDAQDSWVFGLGPITRGSVYDGYSIAGRKIRLPLLPEQPAGGSKSLSIANDHQFVHPAVLEQQLAEEKNEAKSQAEKTIQPASLEAPPPTGN